MVNKSRSQWADNGSEERCDAVNCHRTDENVGKKRGKSVSRHHGVVTRYLEIERATHFPISEDMKRSLMVPPVTDRNAAPQRPVIKRKTMRTAVRREERDNQGTESGTEGEIMRTDIRGKRYRPGEDEETDERPQIYGIPT